MWWPCVPFHGARETDLNRTFSEDVFGVSQAASLGYKQSVRPPSPDAAAQPAVRGDESRRRPPRARDDQNSPFPRLSFWAPSPGRACLLGFTPQQSMLTAFILSWGALVSPTLSTPLCHQGEGKVGNSIAKS